MKESKRYYIDFSFSIGEYTEIGERIIPGKDKKNAIGILKALLEIENDSYINIKIEDIYETSSDARI